MTNDNFEQDLFAICSEFTDTYGFDVNDQNRLVVYIKKIYINELKNLLENKGYKIFSFQTYQDDALVNFIKKN